MNNNIKNIAIILVIFIFFILFYFYKNPAPELTSTQVKCPDDYPQTDAGLVEKMAAMDKWTNSFFDAHPDATLGDWAKARHQFAVDNNCVEALKRYEEAKNGTADPAKMKLIKDIIREEINKYNQ